MLLTIFLAIIFCAAITLMLLSAIAFIQKKEFFASAPKEAQAVIFMPKANLKIRPGYAHCGYMAAEPEKYVKEIETFIAQG